LVCNRDGPFGRRATHMRHPILGLGCTLAFLFVGYAAGWFSDSNEIEFLAMGDPGAAKRAFEALTLASYFALGVLFFVVWPQALLASWLVRRFRLHRFFPLAFFFGVCSILVGILDFVLVDSHRLTAILAGTAYLFVSCFILWWISFRHKPWF
jgi:hypothetical protein